MKEEKQPISIDQQIRKNYRNNFFKKTSICSFYAIFVLLSLLIAYFLPVTIFITVPLIVLPLTIGLISENAVTSLGEASPIRIFFGYRIYFSKNFYGVFRYIEAMLKTILVYLISSSILTLILHFSLGLADSTYMSIFDNLINVQNTADLQKNIEELLVNPTFIRIENITQITSFGLASYMMVHHLLTHLFKGFYNFYGKKEVPMFVINIVHKRMFPRLRRYFYRDYYSSIWYSIIVFVLGYIGGALIAVLLFKRSGMQSAIIGLAFASLLSLYFLPIYFDTYQVMFTLYGLYYLYGLTLVYKDINLMYGNIINFTDEDIKQIQLSFIELENILKDASNKDDEKKMEEEQKKDAD